MTGSRGCAGHEFVVVIIVVACIVVVIRGRRFLKGNPLVTLAEACHAEKP